MSNQGNGRDPSDVTNKLLRDIRRKMATKADLEVIRDTMATKAELGVVLDTLGTMAGAMATKADLAMVEKRLEARIGERIDVIKRAIKEAHRQHGMRINALEVHTGLRPR